MERRQFLGAAGLTAAAAITGTGAGASALAATSASAGGGEGGKVKTITPPKRQVPMDVGPRIPMNKDRASAILKRYGVDGLISLQPYNTYYITNTVPVVVAFNTDVPAFGVFGGETQQSFYVGSNGSLWDRVRNDREVPDALTFTGPANARDYFNATPEQMKVEPKAFTGGYGIKPEGPYTAYEQMWKEQQETYNPNSAPSREWALVKAIREAGLEGKTVAVDDMRIAYMLQRIGYDKATIVPRGEDIFRAIRLIKSPYEIEMMRIAQTSTQQGVMAAARQLEAGMTYDDFRRAFNVECARQGTDPSFLLFGVAQGMLPDPTVREGKVYMIDSSAKFRQYMGDFARTLAVGEPPAEAMAKHKAQQAARSEAFDKIKPGVPFATIEKVARETWVKSGMPEHAIASCYIHSVGLQHDDQPKRLDSPYPMREDFILEKGMVLTLDLPWMEVGGSAGHNEDMILVTETGYELLNDPSEPLIVV